MTRSSFVDVALVGKSASQIRALHFHRDREFLHGPEL